MVVATNGGGEGSQVNFGFTEDQSARFERAKTFGREHLSTDVESRDREGLFDSASWARAAKFGVLGWNAPVAHGGSGLDHVTTVRALEGLGHGCTDNGLTLGLNSQIWAVQEPLQRFGTELQKETYLRPMVEGCMVGAHGMTEPSSGSDAMSLAATAERVDDGFILNGHKIYLTLGPVADVVLVFASTNPKAGKWGLSAFLVEAKTPGFRATPAASKMGMRTAPVGELVLTNCHVPETALLGKVGSGLSIFNHTADYERSFLTASHIGAMAHQLEAAIEHAKRRTQFGQPIGSFQSVSNRIADMALRLENSRLLLYKLAWMKDQGESTALHSAMANLQHSEAFVANSLDAMRTFGGRGYMGGFGVERNVRDALGSVLYSGTSDIQRAIMARMLGL